MEPHERDAVARLAEEVSRALMRFAEQLRNGGETSDQGSNVRYPTKAQRSPGEPRGKQQRAVLSMKGLTRGVTASQVAGALNLKLPNAYKTLASLVEGGWLELVPAEQPTQWRKASPEAEH
jgi:hypothetical protein